jgi:hypothetical protein
LTTIKRTTVYISIGDKTEVFSSPEDIPAPLRKQLADSTHGMNSATILIADRGGRAEIRKILNGEPSPLKSRLRSDFLKRSLGEAQPVAKPDSAAMRRSIRYWNMRQWAELLLPGAVGLGLWLLFTLK